MTRASILSKQLIADHAHVLMMDVDENVDVNYQEDFAKVEEIMKSRAV